MSTVQKLDSFNSNSTCPPNLSTTNTTASSSSAQNADPGSFISTSDCSTLSSPYIPTLTSLSLTSSNISFTIKCDTDYSDPDADFMTVAVFTFEDCIAACASFNEVRLSQIYKSSLLPITTVMGPREAFIRQIPILCPQLSCPGLDLLSFPFSIRDGTLTLETH